MATTGVVPLVDFAPALRLALLALVIALMPLCWWWVRQRGSDKRARLAALTALTMFLTFDLIVFGAFTRLSDSGLGCPDWPGCYGHASPVGADAHIRAAEAAVPNGPVTFSKAWIEMIHRYLAMTVGVLILVMAALAWFERRRGTDLPLSPWWPTATLVWVLVQGLFGKYTVTLKLYPAVVTLHLLGGLVLLMLLAVQHVRLRPRPLALGAAQRWALGSATAALWAQVALGGWVSSNYAVLACRDFPACNGAWWPRMDAVTGFSLLRPLGEGPNGGVMTVDALVAIHMAHRLFAVVAVLALLGLAFVLWRGAGAFAARRPEQAVACQRFAAVLLVLVLAQGATGLGNILLGWPLVAALLHSAGAAALVLLLSLLAARATPARESGAGAGQAAVAAA